MRRRFHTRNLGDIKSLRSVGMRSIPKALRSNYLDLYVLVGEKKRLEDVIFALDKRKKQVNKQLDSIKKQIRELMKETHEKQEGKTHEIVPAKPLKTISISY